MVSIAHRDQVAQRMSAQREAEGAAACSRCTVARGLCYLSASMNRPDEQPVAIKKRSQQELLEKIRSLPPDKLAEVEDFVDFLHQREEERRLTQDTASASGAAFAKVWENPDDAEYDRL